VLSFRACRVVFWRLGKKVRKSWFSSCAAARLSPKGKVWTAYQRSPSRSETAHFRAMPPGISDGNETAAIARNAYNPDRV
jgi:hypothetical protein